MWELYNKDKIYLDKNFRTLDYEHMILEYPSIPYIDYMVFTVGEVIEDVATFAYLSSKFSIDGSVSDEEKIAQINKAQELENSKSSPLERIASALEFIEMEFLLLENKALETPTEV